MSTRLQQRLSFFLDYKVGGTADIEELSKELSTLEKQQIQGTDAIQSLAKEKVILDNAIDKSRKSAEGLTIEQQRHIENYNVLNESVSIASSKFEALRYEYETGKTTSEEYLSGLNHLKNEIESWNEQNKQSIGILRRVNNEQQNLDTQTKLGTRNTYHAQRGVMSFTRVVDMLGSNSGSTGAALATLVGNVNLLNSRVSDGIPAWRVFLNFLKGPAGLLLLATALIPVLFKLNKELGVIKTTLYDTKAAGDAAVSMLKTIRTNWLNAFKEENVPENPVEKARKELELLDQQIEALGGSRSVGQRIGSWIQRTVLQIGALNEAFTGKSPGASAVFTDLSAQNAMLNGLTEERKKLFGELIQLQKIYGNESINNMAEEGKLEEQRKKDLNYYVNTLLPSQLAQDLKASELRISFMQREALTFSQIQNQKNELLGQLKLRQENEVDLLNKQLEKNEISADSHEKRLTQINNSYAQERVEISGWEFEQKRQLRLQMYELDAGDLANAQRQSELRITMLQREALSMDRITKEKAEKQEQINANEEASILTLERSLEEGLISKEQYERQLLQIQQSYAHQRTDVSLWEYEQHRQLRSRMLALDQQERQQTMSESEWKMNLIQREGLTLTNIANLRQQRLQQQSSEEQNKKMETDRLFKDGEINAAEHERRLTLIHREGVLQRKQIDQDSIDDEKALRDQQLMFAEDLANSLMGIGSMIYGSSEKNAKKAFELDKALSLASTATFGALAYVRALATNPASAPFIAATVALNIAKILTTKFKGRSSAPEAAKATDSFQYGFRGIAGSTESGTSNVFGPQWTLPDTLKLTDSGGNFLANLQYAQDKEGISAYMPIPSVK